MSEEKAAPSQGVEEHNQEMLELVNRFLDTVYFNQQYNKEGVESLIRHMLLSIENIDLNTVAKISTNSLIDMVDNNFNNTVGVLKQLPLLGIFGKRIDTIEYDSRNKDLILKKDYGDFTVKIYLNISVLSPKILSVRAVLSAGNKEEEIAITKNTINDIYTNMRILKFLHAVKSDKNE